MKKNILIFSNPFGYGPTGKAVSVASYISKKFKDCDVYMCGGDLVNSLKGDDQKYIKVDERSESSISNVISTIQGPKYIISSQNRFAIRSAKKNNIPCAFLDGLSWFWEEIPAEHFSADVVFWLNYEKIQKKVPLEYKDKVFLIGGITEKVQKVRTNKKKDGTLVYIGGCTNPLTDFPESYVRLLLELFQYSICKYNKKYNIAVDPLLLSYIEKEFPRLLKFSKTYSHAKFLKKISDSKRLITNGGQTAAVESLLLQVPISFLLPINLSQKQFIKKFNECVGNESHLKWEDYSTISKDFYKLSEKDAIIMLDKKAKKITQNKKLYSKLLDDFTFFLEDSPNFQKQQSLLLDTNIEGAKDICIILKDRWLLS